MGRPLDMPFHLFFQEQGAAVDLDADFVVGLDCSTHGAKAIAWDRIGNPVAEGRSSYELNCPRPGWYQQDPSSWSQAAIVALAQVARSVGPRIRAVALSNQRETFAGIDSHGIAVRPAIVWMNSAPGTRLPSLRTTLGDEPFHRISGKPLSITPSISKLLWIRRHEPEAFARAVRWLQNVQAWVARALTGLDVTSVGAADPMGLIDIARADWSDELLGACGLDRDRVPRLIPSGSIAGPILPAVSAATGLPQGTPVVLTAGDGQSAALGAGVHALDTAYLNLGTAIVSGTVGPRLLIDRAFRTMSGALPSTFLLESDLKGGTFTVDWLCSAILRKSFSPAQLERDAVSLQPGSEGLLLLPYFAGVMNPFWDDDASGALVGLRAAHGPAHVYRAILEGITIEQRLHLEAIERVTGAPILRVHAVGGGASSALWCRILADVLQRPILRARWTEATSLALPSSPRPAWACTPPRCRPRTPWSSSILSPSPAATLARIRSCMRSIRASTRTCVAPWLASPPSHGARDREPIPVAEASSRPTGPLRGRGRCLPAAASFKLSAEIREYLERHLAAIDQAIRSGGPPSGIDAARRLVAVYDGLLSTLFLGTRSLISPSGSIQGVALAIVSSAGGAPWLREAISTSASCSRVTSTRRAGLRMRSSTRCGTRG